MQLSRSSYFCLRPGDRLTVVQTPFRQGLTPEKITRSVPRFGRTTSRFELRSVM